MQLFTWYIHACMHIKHYTSFPAVWCLVQPVDHLGKMCIHKCSHLLTHFACSWVQFMRTHTIHRDHQQPHCHVMIGDMTRTTDLVLFMRPIPSLISSLLVYRELGFFYNIMDTRINELRCIEQKLVTTFLSAGFMAPLFLFLVWVTLMCSIYTKERL